MASFSEHAGNYLKGVDLQGREWLVTIEKIPEEDVGDGDKPKLVAHFVGRRKTLPLNKGHIATLSQAFGDNPDNCRGVSVVLFPEQTRTPQGMPAIGVRIKLPQLAQQQPPQAQPQQPQRAETTFVPNARERAEQQAAQPQTAQPTASPGDEMDDEIPF